MPKRVLVVDDEAEFRSLVSDALRLEGYETSEAADGAEAVQAFRAAQPDAVLLDLQMPRQAGLPTLREMHAIAPEVPVIILSGRGDVATAVAAVRGGAFDYIEKPPDFERIALSLARTRWNSSQRSPCFGRWTRGGAVVPPFSRYSTKAGWRTRLSMRMP